MSQGICSLGLTSRGESRLVVFDCRTSISWRCSEA
ncbi:MAG: hypothetical protein ACI8Y4_003493 [Candidatus Poriferisodalaceae bacterium]|jgi:hypothetical protein